MKGNISAPLLVSTALFTVLSGPGHAFSALQSLRTYHVQRSSTPTRLSAAGMGMGVSTASKGKSKAKKGRSKSNLKHDNAQKGSAKFDVGASLLRLEKRYDEILLEASKRLNKVDEDEDKYGIFGESDDDDFVTTEYVVAARDKTQSVLTDWVPFGQLCLTRKHDDAHTSEGSSDRAVQVALSYYCRELSHMAGIASRVFSSIERQNLEYSMETLDSFHKYVYEVAVEPVSSSKDGLGSDGGTIKMTTDQARKVLQITESNLSLREIKQIYRKRSFECHPDRLSASRGYELTEAEKSIQGEEFSKIKLAYETLLESGAVRKSGSSWYESLGGRSRTDFVGPIDLIPLASAKTELAISCVDSAVVGLEPEMVQSFVARSLAGKRVVA